MAVREAKEECQLSSIFDARPGVKIWNEFAGRELLELALKCTRHNSCYRPTLKEVVETLERLRNGPAHVAARKAAEVSIESTAEFLRQELTCPILLEVMTDPVQAEDGFLYERSVIEEHLIRRETSPMTNLPMGTTLIASRLAINMLGHLKSLGIHEP
eukprot:scaffold4089_cov26-Prasinocladus_malaysianus.AAC.5